MEKTIDFIKTSLLGTQRDGMDSLITYMENAGFFTAPCSGGNHLCENGGLAEHSLNVCLVAQKLYKTLFPEQHSEKYANSIVIAALLHDLGKCGQYGKPEYVPNILKSGKQSDSKPYMRNKDLLNVPHEVRSVAIASMFIDLSEEEQHAILMHNGLYGAMKYEIQGNETPLYMIIHWADMWASRVIETEKNDVVKPE